MSDLTPFNFGGTEVRTRCMVSFCRNFRATGRRICHKCRNRRYRDRNPMRAHFDTLRTHARARGIEFSLTFQQFAQFASESSYLELTGPFRMCLTVDRIDNTKGYVAGNIQPLTRSANSVKRCKQDAARMRHGYAWKIAA